MAAIVGYGSTDNETAKTVFMIMEDVCQGIFFIRLMLKIILLKNKEILWNLLDLTTIASTFLGFHLENGISRYFLAFRPLKLVFLIKEVSFLKEEMKIFSNSLRKASYILVPALCLVYVYTAIGLYSFHGINL